MYHYLPYMDELIKLLRDTDSIKIGKYTLSSNKQSNYYLDLRRLNGSAKGINFVAKILYDIIKNADMNIKSIGGLESGSISISTAISMYSYLMHQKDESNPSL